MDPAEFEEFIKEMPAECEPSLVNNDVVSTAFYRARLAGWSVETLAGNAAFQWRRTHSMGIVISNMQQLAQHPPVERDKATARRPEEWKPRVVTYLSPEQAKVRVALLRKITAGEEPPEAMEALILEEKTYRPRD